MSYMIDLPTDLLYHFQEIDNTFSHSGRTYLKVERDNNT